MVLEPHWPKDIWRFFTIFTFVPYITWEWGYFSAYLSHYHVDSILVMSQVFHSCEASNSNGSTSILWGNKFVGALKTDVLHHSERCRHIFEMVF